MADKTQKIEPVSEVDSLIDSAESEDEEIEFDNIDLKPYVLAGTIQNQREVALGPDVSSRSEAALLSLPEIMSQHSKSLGLTEKQFARAAANQGFDVGMLVESVGRKGMAPSDAFEALKDKGTVAFEPAHLESRKDAMKEFRKKRITQTRGKQIKNLGKKRVESYEKEYDYSVDDLRKAYKSEAIDFKKIKEPSKRHAEVAKVVFEMGSGAGLSSDQMAAILANGFAESKLDPSAKSPGDEDSHGVWQFNRGGSGEGSGFTVEQLQDPRFQMGHILKAIKDRDELEGFRNPEADANELTKQFMLKFEKPALQTEKKIKERQAFLKQAKRLLGQAEKSSPKVKSILAKDREKRDEVLNILKYGIRGKFVYTTDEESAGGDVQNEIAAPGTDAYKQIEMDVEELLNPEVSSDPERAKIMQDAVAKYGENSIHNIFAESAFQKTMEAGLQYDTAKAAQDLGQSVTEFMLNADIEGSREKKIRDEMLVRNRNHYAKFLTTNKVGVPAFMSYEFMDPGNLMGEKRFGKGDGYWRRFFHEASRNRVQLVGLDNEKRPVFRGEQHLDSVFNKINLHLSIGAGGIDRVLNGPEGESVVEAFKEGSLEGIRTAKDFTKLLLSTDAAKEGGLNALGLGIVGAGIDILAPDPTLGFAKFASKTREGVKVISRVVNRRQLPQALDDMGTAATSMIDTQVLVNKAEEAFAAGNYDQGIKLLDEAKAAVADAELAERRVRDKLKPVMVEVDRTDSNIALEIARELPTMGGRETEKLDDVLGFSKFGLSRDYVHPSVERVITRGESASQIVDYNEFFDISRKIERLQDLATSVKDKTTQGAYFRQVLTDAVAPIEESLRKQLMRREFTRGKSPGQSMEVTDAINSMYDFFHSPVAATMLIENPKAFEQKITGYLKQLPVKLIKGRTIMDHIYLKIDDAHKTAVNIKKSSDKALEAADLNQELVTVTKSLAGIAESRGAAHAFVRTALAEERKIDIKPVITAVTSRYDEIGNDKISATALMFRSQLEEAFPAMRGDAALHVARNLDDRLKAIQRTTGESVELIYDTRTFRDIIPDLKRKYTTVGAAADVAGGTITDPRFSPMAFGEELLTSKEVRDFAGDLASRIQAQDMTDFTADLATKTVKELKRLAKSNGIKNYSKMRKSSLIETITRNEKTKKFLPDEYLRKNPEVAAQHERAKQKVVDAQKDFESAIDELDALEAANSPTVRGLLDEPSAVIKSIMESSPDTEVISVAGIQVRMFKRDLAEGRLRLAASIRDQRIAEIENLRRISAGKAEETLSLAEDVDFIPGMLVKVEGGTLNVKSIELPRELQKKGIATSLYKVALQRAKKEGLDFASDVNPSVEAQRVYDRLIKEGIPINRIESKAGDGSDIVQFMIGKDDLAKVSDDLLQAGKVKKPVDVSDLGDFVEDTQKVVRAMEEAPTIEDFMLEINKVARRELDTDQMGKVVKWLGTKGITVEHQGAAFIAEDPAVIAKAEEAFAKAFADFARGRPPPTPDTTSAFKSVMNRVLGSFASAKNAQAEGAKFAPSSEIEKVFSGLLAEQKPSRESAPNLLKLLKRALLDDLPNKVGDEYLLRIAQESHRLGYPISVKELKKLVVDAATKQAKNPDLEVTIDLPGPISLGGLLSPTTGSSYTLLDFGRGAAAFATRKRMVSDPATRKIAVESQVNAIKELSPTQIIDQYIKQSKPIAKAARFMYLGDDVLDDMRDLPPKVRMSIMAGVRMTQQSIGDSVTIISEGDYLKLVRFIVGEPNIKFKSGRNAFSAGHDKMGSAVQTMDAYFLKFMRDTTAVNAAHFDFLQDIVRRPIGKKLSVAEGETKKAVDAFEALVFNPSGDPLLREIFQATGLKAGDSIQSKHIDVLESIFYITGKTARKKEFFAGSSAEAFEDLYKKVDANFKVGKKWTDPPVANRVAVLIAGHGQAAKARLDWGGLGVAVDAKTANNFKRWVMGESLDSVEELRSVQTAFRVYGYNPRFLEVTSLDGLDFFVPKSARQKLSMALEQANDPTLKTFSGDMLEALGKGIRETESHSQLAMAWTARYLKTRMVRGHFLLKSRYFWMNTMDHFNQMGQIVGFRPAFISTIRILPQTFFTNPLTQSVLMVVKKAGKDDAGELLRAALTTAGDKGANWAATLTRASKWRGDLNAVLDGRKGFMVVDGIPHAYTDLRRVFAEEGLSASFDTAELGTKIRVSGEMFTSDSQRRSGLMRIPGAPTTREWVKIAEDIAEGWSERERYGAAMTLVEMGVDPRKAARLTIDALYDYAGSMSKIDRHWIMNIFFPFWAFQKNANRQLVDVLFSPRAAYRLGVLNRGYTQGAELISELLYEDLVDPMGINLAVIEAMDQPSKDLYEGLKSQLSEEFGMPASKFPPELRRQIRMAFSGRSSFMENGNWYKINKVGLKLESDPEYAKYRGLLTKSAFVPKPSRSSVPLYDLPRSSVRMPYAWNEQNKKFHALLDRKEGTDRTFATILIPEQSYIAAANHMILSTLTIAAMFTEIRNLGPDYISGADDGADLFRFIKPALDLFQPERGLIVSDLVAATNLSDSAVPYRVAQPLAKWLSDHMFEVLPVDPTEDPLSKRISYSKMMEDFREGKISTLPEDPFLAGETLTTNKRYYISGGVGALIFKNSIFDEFNGIMKKFEQTPHEEHEGIRGELMRFARMWGLVDIRDVNPKKTAVGESYEDAKIDGDYVKDFKPRQNLAYMDYDDYPEQEDKQSAEREAKQAEQLSEAERILRKLKTGDKGEMEIDLE